MQCAAYSTSIQDLIDGTIGSIRRAELDRHLEVCAPCRALVADFQAVRDAAARLDPIDPPARVWLHVAGRLRQEGRLSAPAVAPASTRYGVVLALAAALILAVGLSVVLLLPQFRGGDPAPITSGAASPAADGNASADATVQGVEAEFRLAEQHYQNAIARLEQAARIDQVAAASQNSGDARDQDVLDPQTAAMLQKNLQVIDSAIAESRAALRDEPQSAPARDSLFDALKRKVALLQDSIALMNEMRKGNAAGAARIIQDASKS